jgi:hypothetical protein
MFLFFFFSHGTYVGHLCGKAYQTQKESQQVQVQTQKKAKLKDIFSSDFVGMQN